MVLLWLIERRIRNASIADVGWCYGLTLVVWWYAGSVAGEPARRLLVALMIFLYAVRLGTHVLIDRVWRKQEDGRYRALRHQWGAHESSRMFWYFQLQAAAIAFFSLPPLVVMQNPHPPFHYWDLIGLLWWAAAVTGEAVADRQLAAFRSKPWNTGRVCRIGLWRYSRHPNYFGESLAWWGLWVASLGVAGEIWYLTLLSPLLITFLLLKVSGVPLLEARMSQHPDWAEYAKKTPVLIPWFRRK
jgi:steroid 5-alpha reductase family enzyme